MLISDIVKIRMVLIINRIHCGFSNFFVLFFPNKLLIQKNTVHIGPIIRRGDLIGGTWQTDESWVKHRSRILSADIYITDISC